MHFNIQFTLPRLLNYNESIDFNLSLSVKHLAPPATQLLGTTLPTSNLFSTTENKRNPAPLFRFSTEWRYHGSSLWMYVRREPRSARFARNPYRVTRGHCCSNRRGQLAKGVPSSAEASPQPFPLRIGGGGARATSAIANQTLGSYKWAHRQTPASSAFASSTTNRTETSSSSPPPQSLKRA